MIFETRQFVVAIGLSLGLSVPTLGAQTPATDVGLEILEREIVRLAELAEGVVGVGAIHLETGREVYLNRDTAFPMASTYKVPIATELLNRVDQGRLRLDSMITIEQLDLHPGSGMVTYLLDDPGVILSLRNLLELMLLISDNSATDVVLRTAGGGEAVSARMQALGLDGIRVDRPTLDLIADYVGYDDPARSELSIDTLQARFAELSEEEREAASDAFDADPRDIATPEAMAALLAKIWRREALSEESSALLIDIMTRSTTGAGRIKGLLPPDVDVAHKTGTIGGTTNDVGIMVLPEEAGHVVTVVFVKESELDVEEREHAIAHIARAVYDYFLFNR